MKYSVVIPLYNKEHYIRRTLKSVLAQTFDDFEVIVVNDGSTDNSYREALKVRSDRITVINQENQGVSVARNTGIAHAKGNYIAFLDADDQWKNNYLETIDRLTIKYPQSAIYVTAYRVNMGGERYHYSRILEPEDGCLASYWTTFRYAYDFVWTSATVIRKEEILKAGGFRVGEKIGQDLDMWARVARINPKVAYSSEICVNYNRRAEANARSRIKVAYAQAFIQDLEEELESVTHTKEELDAIQYKYDLKMTVYAFTCILAGERRRAGSILRSWKGKKTVRTVILKSGLRAAVCVPPKINRMLYAVRLKVF